MSRYASVKMEVRVDKRILGHLDPEFWKATIALDVYSALLQKYTTELARLMATLSVDEIFSTIQIKSLEDPNTFLDKFEAFPSELAEICAVPKKTKEHDA